MVMQLLAMSFLRINMQNVNFPIGKLEIGWKNMKVLQQARTDVVPQNLCEAKAVEPDEPG